MATICVGTAGPAVGSRGLIGYAQEGCWGGQVHTPRQYIDMLSESVVSEIGSLVSASLRPDRAVHKRVGGVESAGGDINVELGPNGYGTFIKHALGSVTTTRLDTAFVLKVTNASVTSARLDITHTAGLSTAFAVTLAGGGSTSFSADLTDASADTIGELMSLINAHSDLAAYSPVSYRGGGTSTTLDASDYSEASDPASKLEEITDVNLMAHTDMAWQVNRGWGVYSHVIDADEELPEGLSILIGRDVAAFLYAGSKINTFSVTASPQEILQATFGIMSKGGTTVSVPTAMSGNTGNLRNAFGIRYRGTLSTTCTMSINREDDTLSIVCSDSSENIKLNIAEEYCDPDSGRTWPVHKLGGLLEFLKENDYLLVDIADYVDWETPSTHLATQSATDIYGTTLVNMNFDSTNQTACPVAWGDYIGQDSGTAVRIYIKVIAGGVPGTATIAFSTDNVTYYNTTTTSATLPTEVRTGAGNVNSGFTIFFPDNTALVQDDIWYIETIYVPPASSTVTYLSAHDPFSGFEGALTLDDSSAPIMGWTTTLTNNLFGDKYHLGERTRAMLPEQARTVEGTVTVEFDELDFYRRFLNGTQADLSIAFTSTTKVSDTYQGDSDTDYSMTIRQPVIEFNGATPTISGPEIIQTDFPYVALWDDTNDLPDMRVTLVNNIPYL